MQPNGLSSGPRKFAKLTKPSIPCLRIEDVIVAIYIDFIVTGETYEEWLIGTIKTIKLFLKLGLSSLIGTLTSNFSGNKFGPLYYQELDKCKTLELKKVKDNFDTPIKLIKETIPDLQWWIKN